MPDQITTKPFASRAQAGWAFATHQPFARRWAKQTGPYKRLPYKARKKALDDLTIATKAQDYERAGALADQLSLKGTQIAPGVTRIQGDLCNVHGRYGSCSAAGFGGPAGGASNRVPSKPLPKAPAKRGGKKGRAAAKPRKTEAARAAEREQKRQERQAAQEAKRQEAAAAKRAERDRILAGAGLGDTAGLAGALIDARDGNALTGANGAKLTAQGLAEQAQDGSYRLTASGREVVNAAEAGDAGRVRDTISAARDRKAAAESRAAARAQAAQAKPKPAAGGKKKRPPVEPKKPQLPRSAPGGGGAASSPALGGGGGGGGGKQQEPAQIPQSLRDAVRALSAGAALDEQTIADLVRNGLARLDRDGTPSLTGQGLRILARGKAMQTKAPNPGDYLVVEDAAKPTTYHLQVKRNGVPDHGLMGAAWAALHAGFRGNVYQGPNKAEALAKLKRLYASEGMPLPSEKAFTVFKDASGAWRWLARTTTAFEDRDGEVISTDALRASAQDGAPRGPLRWWHAGRPSPLNADAPWGPGVDLGACDFAALHGRTLIESGTFKSSAIARAVAAKADQFELSPGFFHAADEPDASGVFRHIRIFERSLVPTWAGRASNYYTGLTVQEKSMDQSKIDALHALGVPEATIAELLADVQQTEKEAEAEGVRYKEKRPVVDALRAWLTGEQATTKAEPPPPSPAPDPIAALTAQIAALAAEVASLKAAAETTDAAPVAEAKAGGMMGGDMEGMAEDAAEGGMEEPGEDVGGLTLSPDDLSAIGQAVASALEPLIGALGITQKLDGHLGELKTMLGGYVKQKDDAEAARANEVAALKASIDQQRAQLAELVGDAPRGYRPTQAADNTPWADPQIQAAVKSVPDGADPFADLTAKLFPGLLEG